MWIGFSSEYGQLTDSYECDEFHSVRELRGDSDKQIPKADAAKWR
jgi:hypothetical protein